MNSVFSVLQGSYAYLLIFQIVLVTLLLLVLLWLIARRLREAPEGPNLGVSASREMVALSQDQAEKIRVLEAQITELESSGASVVQLKERNKGLQDKIKFLEQKLLEYEILQEEISTLSVLKLENEKLKKQVTELGSGRPSASVPASAPAPSTASVVVPNSLSVEPDTSSLKPFDDVEEKPSSKAAPALDQEEIDGLLAKIDDLTGKKK